MDWISDSDDNGDSECGTHEAVTAPARNLVNGPAKKEWTSDNDEDGDSGWDPDEGEVHPALNMVASSSKEASEAGPSCTNWTAHFVAMGFSEDLVAKAIQQNREGDTDGVLETLLAYGAVEKSPKREESPTNCFLASDEDALELEDDFSDMEDFGFEDFTDDLSEKDKIVSTLVDMGFLAEEASSAIDRCGMLSELQQLEYRCGAGAAKVINDLSS